MNNTHLYATYKVGVADKLLTVRQETPLNLRVRLSECRNAGPPIRLAEVECLTSRTDAAL